MEMTAAGQTFVADSTHLTQAAPHGIVARGLAITCKRAQSEREAGQAFPSKETEPNKCAQVGSAMTTTRVPRTHKDKSRLQRNGETMSDLLIQEVYCTKNEGYRLFECFKCILCYSGAWKMTVVYSQVRVKYSGPEVNTAF